MKRERRQPTRRELAAITSRRPVARRIKRKAHRDMTRILEPAEQGYPTGAIASRVRLPEEFVAEVLEWASEATDGYKVDEAGEA